MTPWIGAIYGLHQPGEITMRLLTRLVLLSASLVSCAAFSQEFKKVDQCVVGTKVMDRKDRTGQIIGVRNGMCRVQLDGGGVDSYLHWMLRPAGATRVTDKLVTGLYTCYTLAGNTTNYAFIDIHIDGPNQYRDKKGNGGRYRLEPSGRIVFESGSLSSANAKLLSGPRIGLNMSGGNVYNTTCAPKKR
jgi:hypothetical protein